MLGTASKKGNPYDIQNNLVWRQLSLMHKRHSFVFYWGYRRIWTQLFFWWKCGIEPAWSAETTLFPQFQYAEYGTIEKRKTFHYKDKIFELHNGYLIPYFIYAAEAIVELAQIAFKKNPDEEGEKYLAARYSLRGVCCVGSSSDKFEDCTPYGNPIIKTCYPEDPPYNGEKEIYSDWKLWTFAWVELYQNCFKGDNVNGYEIEEPTEEQLACIMRDIPGEAG